MEGASSWANGGTVGGWRYPVSWRRILEEVGMEV